eukprot:gene11523-11666_t
MSEAKATVLKFFDSTKYHGVGARGGALRFHMLANGIRFTEDVIQWEDWAMGDMKLKKEAMQSGESPTGHLPVLFLDGQPLIETNAILRRLAKRHEQYGADEERDYQVDAVVDASEDFRIAWDAFWEMEDSKKEQYKTAPDKRSHFYSVFNRFITQCQGAGCHVVGDSTSIADAVLFGLLWDDNAGFGVDQKLWDANPALFSFYKSYMAQGPIKTWCKAARPDLVV